MEIIIGGSKVTTTLRVGNERFLDLFRLLTEAKSLNEAIKELRVHPDWKESIRRTQLIRAVHGTLAIEGANLGEDQIEKIIEKGEGPERTVDTDKEVENVLRAYEFILHWSTNNPGEKITESLIKEIHSKITKDMNYYLNEPGKYRETPVTFGNPRKECIIKYLPEVQEAMSSLSNCINEKGDLFDMCSDPITLALFTHYMITLIHPFVDGNGRLARAVEALILHHYGGFAPYCFPINAQYYYKNRIKYFELLKYTDDTQDFIPFMIFSVEGIVGYLKIIKKSLLDKITVTLTMDYIRQLTREKKILKRHENLIEIMFGLGEMDIKDFWVHAAIKGLYHNVSESTRKRDLPRLHKLNLITVSEQEVDEKKYFKVSANWNLLESIRLRLETVPKRPD